MIIPRYTRDKDSEERSDEGSLTFEEGQLTTTF